MFDISPLQSLLLASFFAIGFVLSMYFWALLGFDVHNRNDPLVIKQRFLSVAIWTICCPVLMATFAVSSEYSLWSTLTHPMFWEALGVTLPNSNGSDGIGNWFYSTFIGLALVSILFVGPMVESGGFAKAVQTYQFLPWLHVIRALVVGPFAEEWVYRSCICSVLLNGGFSRNFAIICSPILFGLSHAHHIHYQVTVNHHVDEWKKAVIVVAFQLFYTSFFGAIAAYVYVRVGNALCPILMHVFCNSMGFPPCNWVRFRKWRDYVDFAFYVAGLVSFLLFIHPLTEPTLFHWTSTKHLQ